MIYLIVAPDDDPGAEILPATLVEEKFPAHIELIEDRVWIIDVDLPTCSQVADKLELGSSQDDYIGLVFRVKERFGYHYPRFWDELKVLEVASKEPPA